MVDYASFPLSGSRRHGVCHLSLHSYPHWLSNGLVYTDAAVMFTFSIIAPRPDESTPSVHATKAFQTLRYLVLLERLFLAHSVTSSMIPSSETDAESVVPRGFRPRCDWRRWASVGYVWGAPTNADLVPSCYGATPPLRPSGVYRAEARNTRREPWCSAAQLLR